MRRWILIIVAVIILLLSGCNQSEPRKPTTNADVRASMDVRQVFQGVDLQANVDNGLSDTLTWPRFAREYETSYNLKSTEEEIRKTLNLDEDSLDPRLSVTNANLVLSSNSAYFRALTSAFPYSSSLRDRPYEQRAGVSKSDYSGRDLAFMPMEKAKQQVIETLAALGLGDLELEGACALDAETLEKDMQIYASKIKSRGTLPDEVANDLEERLAVSFGETSECYYFSFRMKIGDDPVFTSTATDTEQEISGAELFCLFGPAAGTTENPGFIALNIRRVPTELIGKEEKPIIPPDNALKAVIAQLNESSEQVRIDALDFCYCYYNHDTVLHPTWVLTLSKHREEGENELTETAYFAVDAITGDIVKK